jgi:hypothetical protein
MIRDERINRVYHLHLLLLLPLLLLLAHQGMTID